MFGGKTKTQYGYKWYEFGRLTAEKLRTPLSIAYPEVSTHNHFLVDHGGKVFKNSVYVIKLPTNVGVDEHLEITGVLNSSLACFWLKQVSHNKGSTVDQNNARQRTSPFEDFYAFNGSGLEQFPMPRRRPRRLSQELSTLSSESAMCTPSSIVSQFSYVPAAKCQLGAALRLASERATSISTTMIALQEELDWECYGLYGLLEEVPRYLTPPPIQLGQRAFEIALARKMEAGEEETTWFVRHGSTPITEVPAEWPEEYKQVVQKRIEMIERDRNIALIERPEYKRRWNMEPWDRHQEKALRNWLLDRLESYFDLDGRMNDQKAATARGELSKPALISIAKVADLARQDAEFMQVAELYAGRMDFDVANLVGELVWAESVPSLPVSRYKATGLDKREAWERTWELQRREDAVDTLFEELITEAQKGKEIKNCRPIPSWLRAFVTNDLEAASRYLAEAAKQSMNLTSDVILKPVTDAAKRVKQRAVGEIPIPPKYTSADFLSGDFWRLRGKLDVPKERWVSFPHCEGEDGTLVIAWAGYDHLQLARAVAERYEQAKELEGRELVPLLACIGQLIPWLKQWHNEPDPAFGTRMGDYFEDYLVEEANALGMTASEVMAWQPPVVAIGRKGRKVKT
jgi:hypothetical protein